MRTAEAVKVVMKMNEEETRKTKKKKIVDAIKCGMWVIDVFIYYIMMKVHLVLSL